MRKIYFQPLLLVLLFVSAANATAKKNTLQKPLSIANKKPSKQLKLNKTNLYSLLILLFCLPQLLAAQIPVTEKLVQLRFDSIGRNILRMKPDTNQVLAYDELAKSITGTTNRHKDDLLFKTKTEYAGKELQLAQRLKWNKGVGLADINLAGANLDVENTEQALFYAQKAYNVSAQPAYKEWAYTDAYIVYYRAAGFPQSSQQYHQALAIFQAALTAFKDLPNPVRLSYFDFAIARIYHELKDPEKEVFYENQALRRVHEKNPSEEDVYILKTLADMHKTDNDLVGSLELLQRAKPMLSAIKNRKSSVAEAVYTSSSVIYEALGDDRLALEAEKQALATLATEQVTKNNAAFNQYTRVTTTLEVARLYRQLGEYDKAIATVKPLLAYHSMGLLGDLKEKVGAEMAENDFLQQHDDLAWEHLKPLVKWTDSIRAHRPANPFPVQQPLLLGKLYRDAPDSVIQKMGIKPGDRYRLALRVFEDYFNRSAYAIKTTDRYKTFYELYKTYEKTGDLASAYRAYKNYVSIRDSVNRLVNSNNVIRKDMQLGYAKREDSIHFKQQQLATQLELSNKEKEVQQGKFLLAQSGLQAEQSKLKASQKEEALAVTTVQLQKTEIKAKKAQSYYFIAGIIALLGLSFFIAQNYRNQRKANKLISFEKARSEDLLLNILPADVAEELKEKGSAEARHFDQVTVLFSDFVNFTLVSEVLTPQELVNELNVCFKAFDEIMTTFGIEKIKTIGDAYLAVAGLPLPNNQHAITVIEAAKEMQAFMRNRKQEIGEKTFGIRIGIHSGSVVAGIVGVKKFAYDIWGDTVNTAARMEQNSQPGKINISEKTSELIKDQFELIYRGEIEAKNKGMLKMYFVE